MAVLLGLAPVKASAAADEVLTPLPRYGEIAAQVAHQFPREHISRCRLDDAMSSRVWSNYVAMLDYDRVYFLESDIAAFRADESLLDRYRDKHAYHPVHPVWLFNENQYALDRASKIIIATGESADAPSLVGAEYAATFQDALTRATELAGAEARMLVFPNFFSFVPMVFDVQ